MAEGRALGIFPEGTRSPDSRLYRFRTGVARLAVRTGAPVIPVGLVGTEDVLMPGDRRWHRAPVAVRSGPPLDFSGRSEDERSASALREVTETVRAAVQQLSGQPNVASYAGTVKRAHPSTAFASAAWASGSWPNGMVRPRHGSMPTDTMNEYSSCIGGSCCVGH